MNVKPNEKGVKDSRGSTNYPVDSHEVNTPLTVLKRHRWQLLVCLLIVCVVAFLATKFRKVHYEAVARIQIMSGPPKLSGLGGLAGVQDDFFTTQCQLLQSRRVLSRALENLSRADSSWSASEEELLALQKTIKILPVGGSRLVDIVGTSKTPAKAAAIANEVTAAFISTAEENSSAATSQMMECVNQQITNCDQEIETLMEKLKTFRQQNMVTGTDSEFTATEGRITMLEQQLSKQSMEKINLHSQREKYRRLLASGKGLEGDDLGLSEINSHSSITAFESKLRSLRDNETQLARVYLPGHEKLRSVRFQIENTENELRSQKYTLLGQFLSESENRLTALQQEEAAIRSQLEKERALGVDLTERNTRYTMLLASLQNVQRLREKYMVDAQQYRLEKGINPSPVKLVDAARVPLKPAGLSQEHQVASILLLGILFSITLVFVTDRFANSAPEEDKGYYHPLYIPVPSDMWGQGGHAAWPGGTSEQQPLASIGRMELGGTSTDAVAFSARGHIVYSDQRSSAAAAFRSLGAKLLGRYGQSHHSLVITSASNGDGKTTCASNLALVLAQSGRRVLLVDAHAESPSLDRIFSINGQGGFSDALEDLSLLKNCCQPSDAANLDVLTFGTGGSIDAVGSYEVGVLNNELMKAYDWVIYDAGSLDARLTPDLLQSVGHSIAVCGTLSPYRPSHVIEQVERCGATPIGYLENNAVAMRKNARQGHYVKHSQA